MKLCLDNLFNGLLNDLIADRIAGQYYGDL